MDFHKTLFDDVIEAKDEVIIGLEVVELRHRSLQGQTFEWVIAAAETSTSSS